MGLKSEGYAEYLIVYTAQQIVATAGLLAFPRQLVSNIFIALFVCVALVGISHAPQLRIDLVQTLENQVPTLIFFGSFSVGVCVVLAVLRYLFQMTGLSCMHS